jgi:hypothetical protein
MFYRWQNRQPESIALRVKTELGVHLATLAQVLTFVTLQKWQIKINPACFDERGFSGKRLLFNRQLPTVLKTKRMKTNPNAPARPGAEFYDEKQIGSYEGLTIRQHFASMAMQGLLANDEIVPNVEGYEYCALISVKVADALIDALNKEA